MTPDWAGLRRQWRACAIGMAIWLALLGVWQFLVPGRSSGGPALEFWMLVVVLSVLVPTSFVLAGAATRRLWRARRRLTALVPIPLLCASAWAFPLARDAGLEASVSLWMVPIALLLSTLASATFILFSASPEVPPSDRGMDGWTKAA